ncbi:hypothetical protein N9043_00580 [bacterium]|nr:hypothetical protein [bacterium]
MDGTTKTMLGAVALGLAVSLLLAWLLKGKANSDRYLFCVMEDSTVSSFKESEADLIKGRLFVGDKVLDTDGCFTKRISSK